jgi:glycosyltransferase involved in cell wall biosynthesis
VQALARRDDDDEYVLLCRAGDRAFVEALGPRFRALPERSPHYSVAEQIRIPLAIRPARVDLFHAPHYVVPRLLPCPYVVTIHDCIHLRFPQYLPNRLASFYAKTMMQMAAQGARRVLTVSYASKQDILYYLRIPDDRVEVIYNAPDEHITAPPPPEDLARTRDRYQLTAPFILYTGNIKPHKNLDRLIEAYAELRSRGVEGYKLLIIGDEVSKYANLRRLVHKFQLHQHVRFLGFVSDVTLASLYRLATVFVFPSLYEGFGLPPLEAMTAGAPVITSNVSSLPEVVGDAALLIDPNDSHSIADALARVLCDSSLRADLIRRGLARAQEFSWERSAARVHEVYRELARPRHA